VLKLNGLTFKSELTGGQDLARVQPGRKSYGDDDSEVAGGSGREFPGDRHAEMGDEDMKAG
jgi:hypothetical protein